MFHCSFHYIVCPLRAVTNLFWCQLGSFMGLWPMGVHWEALALLGKKFEPCIFLSRCISKTKNFNLSTKTVTRRLKTSMIFQPEKKRWLYFLGLEKGQTRLKRLLASDVATMQCIYAKAFKMVTRLALKNATYCYDIYWSHETSGLVNKYFFLSLSLCLDFFPVSLHQVPRTTDTLWELLFKYSKYFGQLSRISF